MTSLDARTAATIVWLKEGQQRKPMTSATRLDHPLRVKERLITGAEECTERERERQKAHRMCTSTITKKEEGGTATFSF